MIVVNMALIML